ncbi:MAG TPA: hypothetical protein PLM98_05930 [Thiolinea sp.]|nr:hypothetical protein [Thiolinea sp.]
MKRISLALLISLIAVSARAELDTLAGTTGSPGRALTVSARLDFNINIDKVIYFRVGDASGINTVDITTTASIPTSTTPVTATTGNNKPVAWNGAAPSFSTMNTVSLPVQLRSNAGQVNIKTTVSSPLSNGTISLPFSGLKITSNDSNFPAPLVPDTGTGASVNVTPTLSGLVTERTANWSFAYSTTQPLSAGVYNGQLLFTASAP